jgi:hypothetical protein
LIGLVNGTIISLCPYLRARRGIDQAYSYANLVRSAAKGAANDIIRFVSEPQFRQVAQLSFVLGCRDRGQNVQMREAIKNCYDLVGDAFGKSFLIYISRKIL